MRRDFIDNPMAKFEDMIFLKEKEKKRLISFALKWICVNFDKLHRIFVRVVRERLEITGHRSMIWNSCLVRSGYFH